jgi:hypothetical protein
VNEFFLHEYNDARKNETQDAHISFHLYGKV